MASSGLTTAPGRLKAVLFDAYGTLFNVYSVKEIAEELWPGQGQGQALSVGWREKQIEYTHLATSSRRGPARESAYLPFREVTRCALRYSCKRLGLPLSPDHEARLMSAYDELPAFPEARGVLEVLRGAGVATGVLSNGDPGMLASTLASSGLAPLLDHVISADAVRLYKTHPEVYALGEAAVGEAAGRIGFVSCNSWDALGATWYGYRTCWVNRGGLPFEELGGVRPAHTGGDLRAVLEMMGLAAGGAAPPGPAAT